MSSWSKDSNRVRRCLFLTQRLENYKPHTRKRIHIFSSLLFAKLTQHGLTQDDRLTDALKFSQNQVMQICAVPGASCFQLTE